MKFHPENLLPSAPDDALVFEDMTLGQLVAVLVTLSFIVGVIVVGGAIAFAMLVDALV